MFLASSALLRRQWACLHLTVSMPLLAKTNIWKFIAATKITAFIILKMTTKLQQLVACRKMWLIVIG